MVFNKTLENDELETVRELTEEEMMQIAGGIGKSGSMA